jgi:hypothetical protein
MSAMTIPTMAPLAMSCFGETVVGTMPDGSVDAPFSPATPLTECDQDDHRAY